MSRLLTMLLLLWLPAGLYASSPHDRLPHNLDPQYLVEVRPDGYTWTRLINRRGYEEYVLWLNGWHQGNYRTEDDTYWGWIDGNTWHKNQPLPVSLPRGYRRNFGLDVTKIGAQKGPRYRINGQEVDAETARAAAGAGQVPDDSARQKLSYFLDPEKLRQAEADLKAALGPAASKVCVQLYPSDAWVRRYGFAPDSVYIQNPNGGVLSRTPGLPPPDKLGEALVKAEKLYNPDPNYSAAKDPDLTRPVILGGAGVGVVDLVAGGLAVLVLGGVGMVLLVRGGAA